VTGSGGTLSAANAVWSSVTGSAAAYIVLWKSTGTDSTSPLICLFDTATGLPVTPNGGNITAAWASGQVFTLKQSVHDKEAQRLVDRLRRRWMDLVKRWERGAAGLWLPSKPDILIPTLVLG
jgi:hypothetical protein